jgi:hypothetical protein
MKFAKFLVVFSLIPVLFSGCDKLDRPEPIPSYIYIPSVTFKADSANAEGTSSHKIVDVWVTVGNTYLGAYELPAMIPALEYGSKKILIRAGVLENGIASTRTPYPFYKTYEITVDLAEKEIDTIRPSFKYDSANTHFDWVEPFETGFISLNPTPNNKASYGVTESPDSVFEGNSSFISVLTDTANYLELTTSGPFTLPRGKAVWLEMNYKTEAPIEFGYIALNATGSTQKFVAGVNPNMGWNKIYFNFTNAISAEPSGNTFRLYVLSLKPNDKTTARIFLDNIKLLHLE